jgi:hypothetical protein
MLLNGNPIRPTPVERSWRPRWRQGALVVVGMLALSIGPVTAGSAATPSQTSFTFTGSVKGTLTTPNTACSDQVVTAHGATFMLDGTLKGAPATKWTIQLYAPKAGTSKNFGQENGNGASVTLIGATSDGTTNWNWTTSKKNGSITTTKTSGKVSTTMGPYSSFRGKAGKGKVHVTGSWGCTS